MGSMALSMAKNSRLVIVSASSGKPMPNELEIWMNAWVQNHDAELAALILLAPEDVRFAQSTALPELLQRIANQKNVSFLSEFFEPALPELHTISSRGAYTDEEFTPSCRPRRLPSAPARAGVLAHQ